MKKLGKVYWIIAAALVAGGGICIGAGAAMASQGPSGGESFTETFKEADSIEIDLNACNVNVQVSESAKEFTVEVKNVAGSPKAEVNGGKLCVSNNAETRTSFFNFDFLENFGTVTITIPEHQLKSAKFDLDAINSGRIDGVKADSLVFDFDAADVDIFNTLAEKETAVFDIDAGDVKISNSEFQQGVKLDLDAGGFKMRDVDITGYTDFEADAGSVDFYNTAFLGNVKGTVSAGSLNMDINGKKEDYIVVSDSNSGEVKVDGDKGNMLNAGSKYSIELECSAASADINFNK